MRIGGVSRRQTTQRPSILHRTTLNVTHLFDNSAYGNIVLPTHWRTSVHMTLEYAILIKKVLEKDMSCSKSEHEFEIQI